MNNVHPIFQQVLKPMMALPVRYRFCYIKGMQQEAEKIVRGEMPADFDRVGVEIYVGCFSDVSGPTMVIAPDDEKGIALFKEFSEKLAEHYKTLNR